MVNFGKLMFLVLVLFVVVFFIIIESYVNSVCIVNVKRCKFLENRLIFKLVFWFLVKVN